MGHAVAFFGILLIERGASTEVLPFRTCPIYVHFIRRPAAEYATQKPYGNLTRLSPSRESLACKTSVPQCTTVYDSVYHSVRQCTTSVPQCTTVYTTVIGGKSLQVWGYDVYTCIRDKVL